ncbi:hypothetical protein CPC08DRAFT_702032 [Agrocybe pediades]|nr:hypothetical protein CPC08DRAFT_702032 [Agrocybe pediades]
MAPAAFSRLQLAAALLEYDNDPDDPNAPRRSAQDSAIFAHLRRNPAARPDLASRKSDLLGVSLPSDSESFAGRESALDNRRSRASKASIDALRNPFGADNQSEYEELEEDEEGLEVDLASWGLDSFIPKDKSKSSKGKGKQATPALSSMRSRLPSTNYESSVTQPRRAIVTSKSASLGGNISELGIDSREVDRRRSFGSPLDLVGMEPSGIPFTSTGRAPSISQGSNAQPEMVPFPTSARSPSPGVERTLAGSRLHDRTTSMASMDSRMMLGDANKENIDIRQRNLSSDTYAMLKAQEDNPFAIHNATHISRFDPKSASRARSFSNASLGSRMMLENDGQSVMTRGDPHPRERPYSTLELLRPKVLVMPSPLQPSASQVITPPTQAVRDGFELSTDGPPLPPGARSTRRLSGTLSTYGSQPGGIPIPSNSFTPNPLVDLSLSQKTFRNTLFVPGESVANLDVDNLPRATEDGEQAVLYPSANEESQPVVKPVEDPSKVSRPAGKLYGKSLIDDLENRKAQMRSKQRVFTGDQRPSMMAREQSRSSTLIDPAGLQRPVAQRNSSYGSLGKDQARLSVNPLKPLLNFEEDNQGPLQPPPNNRLPSTRSVFGVDTLWQREMAKLKEIQAAEEAEKEAQRRREEEEGAAKKKKKKNKKKGKDAEAVPEAATGEVDPVPTVRVSTELPPVLPVIQRATRRAPPKPSESDESSSESDEDIPVRVVEKEPSWHVDSSDEENTGPRRTTGVGPRYPTQRKTSKPSIPPPRLDSDSEEDLPLAATIHKAEARAAFKGMEDSDEEDKPLSQVIRGKSQSSGGFLDVQSTFKGLSLNAHNPSDEDDDQPLGLRASRMIPNPTGNAEDEDDRPLAFHPEHQRRTQYQMLAQVQQQQQQQMLLQAQMQSNMMMNASMMTPGMMSPGYFPPPIMNPVAMMQMQAPIPIPSPPPVHDEAKFGLVDRWRRDVVIEGENA